MAHARTAIRNAFVAAVTGLTTTSTRVYKSRVWPLESVAASLLVYTLDDTSEPDTINSTIGGDRAFERVTEITCEARAGGTMALDDLADLICEEVEDAIGADATLSGVVKDVYLTSTEIEYGSDGDQPMVNATMTFAAEYRTLEGAASTAV